MKEKKIWNNDTVKEYISQNSCYWFDDKYINMKTNLNIKMKCGHIHVTTLDTFIHSKHKVCTNCKSQYNKANTKYNIDTIKDIVNKSGVEVLSKEYAGIFQPMKFKCTCGEIFTTNWNEFNNGDKRTCNECSRLKQSANNKLRIEDIRKRVMEISDCILISDNYIDAHSPLIFKCDCGRLFTRTWANFTNENKRRCHTCNANYSINEKIFAEILDDYNIKYHSEYAFLNCKNKQQLYFDFYLPILNICVEIDGEHHFLAQSLFGGDERFIEIKKLDKIKNDYCKSNNIKLIRIPYWSFNDINKIKNFVEAGLLVDDDYNHLNPMVIWSGYDKENERMEVIINYT